MTTAHGRYLAGYRSSLVEVVCGDCGHEWDDQLMEEYGTGWLEGHEQCPKCGASGDTLQTSELSAYDIQERKYEARGEDF